MGGKAGILDMGSLKSEARRSSGSVMTESKRTSLSNTVVLLTPRLQCESEDANQNFISLLRYMPQWYRSSLPIDVTLTTSVRCCFLSPLEPQPEIKYYNKTPMGVYVGWVGASLSLSVGWNISFRRGWANWIVWVTKILCDVVSLTFCYATGRNTNNNKKLHYDNMMTEPHAYVPDSCLWLNHSLIAPNHPGPMALWYLRPNNFAWSKTTCEQA